MPLDHLILGLPATAAVFTLKDEELNTPRSPAAGTASFIPYREVRDSAAWLCMFQCLCNDYHNKDNNDNDYDIIKRKQSSPPHFQHEAHEDRLLKPNLMLSRHAWWWRPGTGQWSATRTWPDPTPSWTQRGWPSTTLPAPRSRWDSLRQLETDSREARRWNLDSIRDKRRNLRTILRRKYE